MRLFLLFGMKKKNQLLPSHSGGCVLCLHTYLLCVGGWISQKERGHFKVQGVHENIEMRKKEG